MPFYPAKTIQDEFFLDLAFQTDCLIKTDRYTYHRCPGDMLLPSHPTADVSCLSFDIFYWKKKRKNYGI